MTDDWTVGEDTGETKTGTGDGAGVDIKEAGVDGGDGSGVGSGVEAGEAGTTEDGADVDILEGQFRALWSGDRHFKHRPEYWQSRGR